MSYRVPYNVGGVCYDLYIPCLIEFLTVLWGMLRLVYPILIKFLTMLWGMLRLVYSMSYRVPYNVMGYVTTCIFHVL